MFLIAQKINETYYLVSPAAPVGALKAGFIGARHTWYI
jgi:hypothetical protein